MSVVANSLYWLRFLAEFELKKIFHPPSPVLKFVRKFGAVVPDTVSVKINSCPGQVTYVFESGTVTQLLHSQMHSSTGLDV